MHAAPLKPCTETSIQTSRLTRRHIGSWTDKQRDECTDGQTGRQNYLSTHTQYSHLGGICTWILLVWRISCVARFSACDSHSFWGGSLSSHSHGLCFPAADADCSRQGCCCYAWAEEVKRAVNTVELLYNQAGGTLRVGSFSHQMFVLKELKLHGKCAKGWRHSYHFCPKWLVS